MDQEIIEFDQKKIQQFRQSNVLINSIFKASLIERRFLATMISMIKPDDTDFKEYKININKFASVFEIKGKSILNTVREATFNLMKVVIQIRDGDKLLQTHWISSVKSEKGSSDVIVRFGPELKPYLLNLHGQYTSALLGQIAKFKSKYSIALYQLCKQYYPPIDIREFELEELKLVLDCDEDYPVYANFKTRVLKRAVDEINEVSDLNITFSEPKKGKKVHKIIFKIGKNDKVTQEEKDQVPKMLYLPEAPKPEPEKKKKKTKTAFVPPTKAEWIDYCRSRGVSEADSHRSFDGYETASWEDSRGNKIINWKQKVIQVWQPKDFIPGTTPIPSQSPAATPASVPAPESGEIIKIRNDIKFAINTNTSNACAAIILSQSPIRKEGDSFVASVLDQRLMQFQQFVTPINVKIEVKT